MLEDSVQIYVLHHKPLTDRKKYFLDQLTKYELNCKWIEEYTPDSITLAPENSNITITEYSLYLKHKHALEDQITNKFKYSLIFEDDALLGENFLTYFKNVFTEFLDLNGDILMLGTALFPDRSLTVKNIIPNKHVYYNPGYTTRCTHAILYSLNAAQHVVKDLNTDLIAYDHKLNGIILKNNLKTCWVEPGLLQGSRPDTPTTHFWHTSIR